MSQAMILGSAKLYIVRHGQCASNVFPRQAFFSPVDPDLTDIGVEQARTTGSCLAAREPLPDFIFTSCLVRAQQTALRVFPNQTVIVSPYISEEHWGYPTLHPASSPTSEQAQLAKVTHKLGHDAAMRDSFNWTMRGMAPDAVWPDACGPPGWDKFLDWLANQEEVKDLVRRRLSLNGSAVRIAVVSHGNFLEHLLARHGWPGGHPRNAEAFQADLSLLGDPSSLSLQSFGHLVNVESVCSGNDPSGGINCKAVWIILAALVVAFSGAAVRACRLFAPKARSSNETHNARGREFEAAVQQGVATEYSSLPGERGDARRETIKQA